MSVGSGPLHVGRWRVEHLIAPAADAHAAEVPADADASVWVITATGPALVLGSTQPAADVDVGAAAQAGVDIVRRRSGGGAVLVVPGELVWIDVIVPRGDVLWDDDVARASFWLGEVWAEVATSFGFDAVVHRGPLLGGDLARTVCFAGVGPGEVTVEGAKMVGISQRRTRNAARFQCACLLRWRTDLLTRLLPALDSESGVDCDDGDSRAPMAHRLAGAGRGIGADAAHAVVERTLSVLSTR